MLPSEWLGKRGTLAHSCVVGKARGSEGMLPKFSNCKGDSGRNVLSDLQNFVKIALM